MARLFFRVFYMVFLWVILLANLLFVFDLTSVISPFGSSINPTMDFSDKYFGISTLITAFKNIDNWPIGQVTTAIGMFYRDTFKYAQNIWSNLEWPSFDKVSNFWDGFLAVLNVLVNIGKIIGSLFVYSWAMVVMLVYFVMMIMTIFFSIINLFGGYYVSTAPPHQLWEIGNCITPLLTAV